MKIDVSGFKPTVAQMEAIRAKIAKAGRRKALRAGGNIVRTAMIERAPMQAFKRLGSNSLEPGEMKAGIRILMITEDGEQKALVGPIGGKFEVSRAAHLVEYGHRMVTGGKSRLDAAGVFRGGGKVHAQDVPPHPFLRPAFEASSDAALKAMGQSIEEDLSNPKGQ